MDDRGGLLAERAVGDADDSGVGDRGMLVEAVLDLRRIDILAAAQHHVLRAVDDVREAFVVEAREVAGADPAAHEGLGGRLRLVPIAHDDHRPARPEFADRAGGERGDAILGADFEVGDGDRRAGAGRAMEIILGRVRGDRRHRLGHPPAVAGERAELLVDALDEFGRRGSAAIGDRLERGEVVARAVGVLDQLPRDRRDAAGDIDALALDDPHCLHRVPLAHEDHRVARCHAAHQGRRAGGDVEQRDHGQDRARRGVGDRLAAADEIARRREGAGEDVGGEVAVRAERALRVAGGAAGVEDRRGVVAGESDVRAGGCGERRPAGGAADEGFERGRALNRLGRPRDDPFADARHVGAVRGEAAVAFGVDDDDARARIADAVAQFVAGPPGVERHRDRADRDDREEDHRPFGQVARCEGDAVALADAAIDERLCKRGGRAILRLEAHALVVEDRREALAVGAREVEQQAKVGGRVLPDARRDAADRRDVDLELAAGGGERGGRVGERDFGPGGVDGNEGLVTQIIRHAALSPCAMSVCRPTRPFRRKFDSGRAQGEPDGRAIATLAPFGAAILVNRIS